MESNHEQSEEKFRQEVSELLLSLPKEPKLGLYLYQNRWYRPIFLQGLISFQRHFEALDQDIIVASYPKSGTTWLKGLVFSIINRTKFPLSQSPLLTSNSHKLAPFLEVQLYNNNSGNDDVKGIPSPRLFGTHVSYTSLSESIKKSKCRLVYVCRNPFDVIVSYWHFMMRVKDKVTPEFDLSMDEFADLFSRGMTNFGPIWNHVFDYWKESSENPNKVLFLKYEDMKENTFFHVKRLAEFIGYPFTLEEEANGVVEQIIELCSFQKMKDLDVNKCGNTEGDLFFENNVLFRKAEVGDFHNYLSDSCAENMKNIIQEKLTGSGLNLF